MTPFHLATRGLRFYWRPHLAVAAAVAVACAVLTGALAIGDSVRGTLTQRLAERLGRVHWVLAGGIDSSAQNWPVSWQAMSVNRSFRSYRSRAWCPIPTARGGPMGSRSWAWTSDSSDRTRHDDLCTGGRGRRGHLSKPGLGITPGRGPGRCRGDSRGPASVALRGHAPVAGFGPDRRSPVDGPGHTGARPIRRLPCGRRVRARLECLRVHVLAPEADRPYRRGQRHARGRRRGWAASPRGDPAALGPGRRRAGDADSTGGRDAGTPQPQVFLDGPCQRRPWVWAMGRSACWPIWSTAFR